MRECVGKRLLAFVVLAGLAVSLAGCGQTGIPVSAEPEAVELLDPVGVAAPYETAVLRNMYSTSTYTAVVGPYVEEYAFESGQVFSSYGTYPGERVSKGGTLLNTNTEWIDLDIENTEKSIADMEESYNEFMKNIDEELAKLRKEDASLSQILEKMKEQMPPEFITTQLDDGTEEEIENPEYQAWSEEYNRWEKAYRANLQPLMEQEEALRQRTELYELDHAYQLSRLNRLKTERTKKRLTSGMAGYVVGLQFYNTGDWVVEDTSIMAVADPDRKLIRSSYVDKTAIRIAKDVYAIIDGRRYEVEYEPMDADEYARLESRDGVVYTTFYFKEDVPEVRMGDYCTIVVVTDVRENVLTVSSSAVHMAGLENYVYLEKNGDSVYTPVKTGFRDGVCVEILSGLSEGDRVRTDKTVEYGQNTVILQRGTVSYDFSATGYLYYPDTTSVENPVKYGTCYVTKCDLTMYQQVKKGEVLATIRVAADQVGLERLRTQLNRERERLADLISQGEEKNEKAIEAKQETIADLEERIRDMEADFATKEIRSPMDGVIISTRWFEEEQILNSGVQICIIADQSRSYVVVEDTSHQLNYGDQLDVTYAVPGGGRKTVQGTVVTAGQRSVSGALQGDEMLITVPAEAIPEMAYNSMFTGGFWNRRSFDVTGQVRSTENVILVPKSAVTLSNGSTYVNVVREDGSIVNQSFVAGGSNNTYYWVVQGLSEGMEICLR